VADLGLLMTDAMALACHDGRKTVTRRPIRVQPPASIGMHPVELTFFGGELLGYAASDMPVWAGGAASVPGAGTAKVGGRVWIRECFSPHYHGPRKPAYRADYSDAVRDVVPEPKWLPSIHMPKWACRTWGRIVSVRPERVQDITDEDARREGFNEGFVAPGMLPCVAAFRSTWNACYLSRGLGWDANPWVWRIEWERIERPGGV
jgi:hypothetical protein